MIEAKEVAQYVLWRIYLVIGLFTTGSMFYFLVESDVKVHVFIGGSILLLTFFGWPVVWGIQVGTLLNAP